MKKSRIFLVIVGIIVVVAGGAVFYLIQNLDAIVKAAIEKYGSETAGTAVRVESVEIGLKEGRGSVRGLSIADPAGFSGESIFRLGEITLDLDTATVTSEVPVIDEIRIGETGFLFEVDRKGKTNLDVLKANLRSHAAAGKKSGTSAGEKAPIRLRVKRLTIAEGQGKLDLTAIGGKVLEGRLPPVTLTDIGGREGITPAALGDAVLAALVKNLEQSAARQGAERMIREKFGEQAGKLQEKLDEKLGPGAGDTLKKMLGQ